MIFHFFNASTRRVALLFFFCSLILGSVHFWRLQLLLVSLPRIMDTSSSLLNIPTYPIPLVMPLISDVLVVPVNPQEPAKIWITDERVRRGLVELLGNNHNLQSDIVELDHCSLATLDWDNFTSWARPILNKTLLKIQKSNQNDALENITIPVIQQEWTLELLELHATHHGHCDFRRYKPTVPSYTPNLQQAASTLRRVTQTIVPPPYHARVAFAIVAYKDAKHLERLIQAIHMPHHLILIHLERSTSMRYFNQVLAIVKQYQNVVILQFGTVLYRTDSVSMINLRIMRWLVEDLQLEYDYHAVLGGAVYPLYEASELAQHIYKTNLSVWLGEMNHKGSRVKHPQAGVLFHKRLISSHGISQKAGFLFGTPFPDWMDKVMQHKSISGNQAVYSQSVVRQLLANPRVMQLFGMAKYGCCCCIEERVWIAAMDLIGLVDAAKKQFGVWQVWGGHDNCRATMSNALLNTNPAKCFRLEDPNHEAMYISGNETLHHLQNAKRRGFLFARKFLSDDAPSMALLKTIETILHRSSGDVY
jgi:hypothetical protein